MAHDAAESVAPTNYYTMSERNKEKRGGWREERTTGSRWTCLVIGVQGEELAVKMSRQDNAPCRVWVLRRDHVGEIFRAIWCRVHEAVLLYVPVELAERRNDVVSNKRAVFGVG
jgi:hypothetical protein